MIVREYSRQWAYLRDVGYTVARYFDNGYVLMAAPRHYIEGL